MEAFVPADPNATDVSAREKDETHDCDHDNRHHAESGHYSFLKSSGHFVF